MKRRPIVVELAGYELPTWNESGHGRMHWAVRTRKVHAARALVAEAWGRRKKQVLDWPVVLITVSQRPRALDSTNMQEKDLEDGLKGLVLKDDSRRYVTAALTIPRQGPPHTWLILWPAEERLPELDDLPGLAIDAATR